MPLYFGSDNKIYDSDLDGSTAYAGNTADYKSINSYDYANILKFYSKNNNQNIFFDNSTTSGFSVSRKNYIFGSKEEKTYHFTNLVNNYINKQISLLNYNPNTVETYLNSTTQGFTSDAIAIINWKNNLENKRDQAVDDFMSGITDGLPRLNNFIKDNENNFYSLGSYRGGTFSRTSNIFNNNIDLMGSMINEGGSGGARDCESIADEARILPEPENTTEIISMKHDYCIPQQYSFPRSFFTDSKNLSSSEFANEYIRGGTSENLGCPIFKMTKNNSGVTSDVYLALTPTDISDQSKGITPVEYTIGDGSLTSFYEEVRNKTGILDGQGCAYVNTQESDIYDPITNPCGLIGWACECLQSISMAGNVFRSIYYDYSRNNNEFQLCETSTNFRPIKPIRLPNGNIVSPYSPLRFSEPKLLWKHREESNENRIVPLWETWTSENYSGALKQCRSSGVPGSGDRFWHGLTTDSYDCWRDEEKACYRLGSTTQFINNLYTVSYCRSGDPVEDFGYTGYGLNQSVYPDVYTPPRIRECVEISILFQGYVSTTCSTEFSCECGCNPLCCECVCAGNHSGEVPDWIASCTGGTCAYETREVDIVFPTINTDINQIIDDYI